MATVGFAQDASLLPKSQDHAAKTLNNLFGDLKRAKTERDAERISDTIWSNWMESGDRSIDLMMTWSQRAVTERQYGIALDYLDQIVVMAPNYAESWNRRATLHFMRNNFAKSMADIQRTLELEPRHFGALAGMAAIFQRSGETKLALRAFEQVLDVYPMNRNAQKAVSDLSEELTDETL